MTTMVILPIIAFMVFSVAWSDTNVTIPKLNETEWWGPSELIGCQNTSIIPFEVEFSDTMISDLRSRLNATLYAPSLEDVGYTYGFNIEQLPIWIKYWAEEYPFKEREVFFNKYPQYTTYVQGLKIHFLWVKPEACEGLTVVPLLLMHGWPGSIREFYEVIPLLTSNNTGYNFTFEVVIPSLPGFGFSDATSRVGLGPSQMGVIFKNLMSRLGHEKFYIQGGDMGAIIASSMATLLPDNILGHHTNMPAILSFDILSKIMAGHFFPDAIVEPERRDRIYPLSDMAEFFIENFGYFHLQATKPDSIAVALSDSPAGLLVYIISKFPNFKNKTSLLEEDGGLSNIGISNLTLIDNLMVYWSSNKITSAMRLYAECTSKKTLSLGVDSIASEVPVWVMQTKYEIIYQPAKILKSKYPNLLGATVLDYGGHFMSLQYPDVFCDDVFKGVNACIAWNELNSSSE